MEVAVSEEVLGEDTEEEEEDLVQDSMEERDQGLSEEEADWEGMEPPQGDGRLLLPIEVPTNAH